MKKMTVAASLMLLCAQLPAQEKLDSTVVSAFRAGEKTPVTHTDVSRRALLAESPGASLPMDLALQPSFVVTNEGGTGLGYSKMRIRGSDGSRINVTLNGITLNDAESQEVFWVNIPGLAGMLESVQIQRGVGTSVNGPGAFGASINMISALPSADPYFGAEISGGSFLTGTLSAEGGSGRLPSGLALDGRVSCATTEGYIDNAFARVASAYASASWYKGSNSLKFNYIGGLQKSGITWEGCPREMLETDRRYNPAHSGDSDNYAQHHFQGLYSRNLAEGLDLRVALNYTRGDGYYETFVSEGCHLRQAMANHYFVADAGLSWRKGSGSLTADLSGSFYGGKYFGFEAFDGGGRGEALYFNDSQKSEMNASIRAEYLLGKIQLYGDLHLRSILYSLEGVDEYDFTLGDSFRHLFFSPKAGLSWSLSRRNSLYASVSIAHKEPCRSDVLDALRSASSVRPETLYDCEIGWRHSSEALEASVNLYFMEYRDQLLETGRIDNIGYKIRENVPRSFRRGVELSGLWRALPWLGLSSNWTFSVNRIKDSSTGSLTPMIMSPAAVGMASATFLPFKRAEASLRWKFVGSQYYDNTVSLERRLPSYDVFSLVASYSLKKIKFTIFADNLLDRKYIADAWSDGGYEGFFPQAGFNFNVKLTYSL